jgi:DNA-binding beta-propeller fold protein YncE
VPQLPSPRSTAALALTAIALAGATTALALAAPPGRIGPSLHIVNSGRHLTPFGKTVAVGNVPMGGAATPDGRFYWAVSGGAGLNDLRIVSVKTAKVVQVVPLPGASGGVAIDPHGGKAYVSGLADSTNKVTSRPKLPGGKGDVIHVFSYSKTTGKASETGRIAVPPPPGAPLVEDFPIHRAPIAYPEHLAITSSGNTLLVPLGLADAAAIVKVNTKVVKYVPTGHYPYGAAVLPGNKRGLVSNEAPGTVSVIDLQNATKIKDINVGGHLAHPEAIVARGTRAFVTVTNRDQVAVIDTKHLNLERNLSVKLKAGVGSAPDAVAVTPGGGKLLVAESGADRLTVFGIPVGTTHDIQNGFKFIGRIPTAHYPTGVEAVGGGKSPTIIWLSAKGLGIGPNPKGPNPFNSSTLDQSGKPSQFMPRITFGSVGIGTLPSGSTLSDLTKRADAQVLPANHVTKIPANTPLRLHGPIKHVFFIVRENRTYDQVLGDDTRGDGKKSLTLFGQKNTPNMHALVKRFPLVDHLYANSEASQQGHQWTAAGSISDYAEKNWNQITNIFGNYGARGRPLQTGIYTVTFPPRRYLFDQAIRQKISFFNYGEVYAGNIPLPYPPIALIAGTTDKDRTAADAAAVQAKFAHSDIQPGVNGGCYPNAFYTGKDILSGKWAFDSTVPAGAPAGSESRTACFRQRFAQQVAAGKVPTFNYITLMNDHTRGLEAGSYRPQAMIADNDRALGQIVDTISHKPAIWAHSAIFVVEDDSQDGADHVDAHRIPAAVISPYARGGAVVHTRYDQLSVIRSMELIMGMSPLSLNDALATPMYDAFQASPSNISPFTTKPESESLLAKNPAGTHGARESAKVDFVHLDAVPQHTLDNLLWEAVHGRGAKPPAAGPNASGGVDAGG